MSEANLAQGTEGGGVLNDDLQPMRHAPYPHCAYSSSFTSTFNVFGVKVYKRYLSPHCSFSLYMNSVVIVFALNITRVAINRCLVQNPVYIVYV